ncbi:MAG: YgeY family selenium metabolism-linked hydrolase [Methanomassiliicoccales archaeon]|nr:YgeY family selenium metabolism-linked hydrolase [Methanomassiliicoccales archaeon]
MRLSVQQREELIGIVQELIRRPSYSGEEEKVAKFIKQTMEELGYDEAWIDEYGNVIGKISGKGNGKSVVFEGHMDTVVVDNPEDWTHDPFGAEIVNGKIYGRGTSDMKGALGTMIYAASLIPKEKMNGNVYVVGVVMEEIFEGIAFGKVLDKIPADYVVLGESTNLNINIGQRGRAEIVVKTKGKPAHSSNPQLGVNAVYNMIPLIERIRNLKLPSHEFLGDAIIELTDIISKPYPGASVVPYECRATFDRRLIVGETEESVLKPIKDIIAELREQIHNFDAEVEIASGEAKTYTGKLIKAKRFFPAWLLDRNHELAQKSLQAVNSLGIPAKFSKYSFCTDGSQSAGVRGIPTIGYGPSTESLAHVIDEYIEIEHLVKAAEGYIAIGEALLR